MIGNIKIIAVCMCKVYDERNYRIIRALNNFAVENDYRLFVYHTCSDLYWKTLSEKGEQSVFDLIDYNITDAVVTFEEGVYAENVMTKIRMDAAEYGKPVISVGVEHDDCISIKFGYAKGFEQVVRHVIEQHGVRDIGFIAGRKDEENSEERIAVFRKLLEEYDIPFRNDVFYYGDYWSVPALKAVDDMIEKNKVPRAIICANDMMAIAAGAEFQRRGYKIPEDIIVTGFDGSEEANFCTPMLTTSGCSYDDTAKTIIDVISKALAGEKPEKIYTVDYDLSVENSCGCKPSVEQINTGEYIRILRDRMNRYQDEERVLYELAVNIMNCETPKTLATLLKEYNFGDVAVVVNGDFFDERKAPGVISDREPLFSDKMILLRSRAVEDRNIPQPFDRTNIIPDIENIMDYKVPLIFSALVELCRFDPVIAATISFVAGLLVNYVLSTFWIFKKSKIKNRLAEFAAFAAVGVVGLGINAAIIWFFKDILASKLIFGTLLPQDKYYLVGKLVSTVIVFIWNFAGRKFIIFDKNKD